MVFSYYSLYFYICLISTPKYGTIKSYLYLFNLVVRLNAIIVRMLIVIIIGIITNKYKPFVIVSMIIDTIRIVLIKKL